MRCAAARCACHAGSTAPQLNVDRSFEHRMFPRTALSSSIASSTSASNCPYVPSTPWHAASRLWLQVGAKYTALELDTIPDGKAIRAELTKKTGRTSVPNIFIQGQGVGGCNDGPGVMTLQSQGKLQPMLKAAGAL